MIDEKCMTVMCHGQLCQSHVEQAFNKKVRPKVFEEGDLVLKKQNQALLDHRGKFTLTYEGPYVVKKAFFEGALILAYMCKVEFNQPSCWLYSVPNLFVFYQLVTLYLGENHVRVMCERV